MSLLGIPTRQLAAAFGSLRKTRSVPPAPKGLNQQDCVRHTTPEDIDGSDFICQRGTLRGDHLQIACYAAFVASYRKVQGVLRRHHRFILHLGFVFQNSYRRQIVFHLLESSQYVFPIGSDLKVISSTRLVGKSTTSAHVEDCTYGRQPNRPQTARPI